MLTIPAREAKNRFGHVLEESQHEDVTILRNGKPYSVVMSVRRYRQTVASADPDGLNRETIRLLDYLGIARTPGGEQSPEDRVRSVRDDWD